MRKDTRANVCKPLRWVLIVAAMTTPGLLDRAAAQVANNAGTFLQITGPALANPGEHLSFCFQRVEFKYTSQNQQPVDVGHSLEKAKPSTATLRILDAITGAEKVKKDVSFPVEGSPALPSDPCVEYVIPTVSSTTAALIAAPAPAIAPAVYIGVVSVSSEPVPPGVAPVSSLDIFTPIFGVPANIRHIVPSVTCPPSDTPCVY